MIRPVIASLAAVFFLISMPTTPLSADAKTKNTSDTQSRDLADLKQKKLIRVLLPYSITYYYLENGMKKGAAAAYIAAFEDYLNKDVPQETAKIRVQFMPMDRDDLLTALARGLGDIAMGGLTITPERQKLVDFSTPVIDDVRTLIVTGPDHPPIKSLADIAGMEIHARSTSSYFETLGQVNKKLTSSQLSPVTIRETPDGLSDADILEMVNENIVPATIMEGDKIRLWSALYKSITVHEGLPLKVGEQIGWAIPKGSTELKQVLDDFIKKVKPKDLPSPVLFQRDYGESRKLLDPKTDAYLKKFKELSPLFETFGKKYDIDPSMLAAQAFQESHFDQHARSRAGAVGLMQMLPSTARDRHVDIPDIYKLENNIEAGAKYMRFLMDRYFSDPKINHIDRLLLAYAAYNAGPHRVIEARKGAPDPNKWFNNVEWEVGRAVGSQPLNYVRNIYIYNLIFSELATMAQSK